MPKNADKDLGHVYEALYYKAEYFLTNDEKFLKKNYTINENSIGHKIILEKPHKFIQKFFSFLSPQPMS